MIEMGSEDSLVDTGESWNSLLIRELSDDVKAASIERSEIRSSPY